MRLNLTLAGGGGKKSGNPAAAMGNIAASITGVGGSGGTVGAASGTALMSAAGKALLKDKRGSGAPRQISNPIRPKPAAGATGNIRDQAVNIGNQAAMRNGAENIRNTGGGRGVEIAQAVRALKGLTGK